mgnify:CR=1 FL=1
MILRRGSEGIVAVPQSAHALVAFGLARLWGNRQAPRPSPVNEVLAAVLLHDAGWDLQGREPALTPSGELASFDAWPQGEEREALWADTFRLATTRSTYVAYLVGHHLLHLAQTYSPGKHASFVAELSVTLSQLEAALRRQPAYRQIFATGQDAANRAILRVTDALALHLCLGAAAPVRLAEAPFKEGFRELVLKPVGEGTYRLHPWPFVGKELHLAVEGKSLPTAVGLDPSQLGELWRKALAVRLTFRLVRLGSPLA